MEGRHNQRRVWLGGVVAYGIGIGLVVLTLLLLQGLASGGESASVGLVPPSREPIMAKGSTSQAASGGWRTVFTETFEDGIGPEWTVTDTSTADGGTVLWGTSTFTHASGDHSAWCAGGGDAVGDLYTDSIDTWLVSDPIVLGELGSHVWDAEMQFTWWLDARFDAERRGRVLGTQSMQRASSPPPSGDWFGWGAVKDVTDLASGRGLQGPWTYVSGATGGWVQGSLPLDGILPLGADLTSTVRIAFRFVSDDDGAVGRGAFVDDVVLRVDYGHRVALPLLMRNLRSTAPPGIESLLVNGGFETDWGEEMSHRVKVCPVDGPPYVTELGPIHTPPGWLAWFRHDPGVWDQPEINDMFTAGEDVKAYRVRSGERCARLFTFFRKHDAGFMQQVVVEPNTPLTLTAYAHAWSNHPIEGHEDCKDDGHCSAGVGWGGHFLLPDDVPPLNGDPWNDAVGNFAFMLGIDPTGGTDPFADTVEWGTKAYIYNQYHQVPSVRTMAEAQTVTVFLRSTTLWPFKHNDAHWDDVELLGVRGATPP